MEDVLVALIIQLCKHDTREYRVQDEYVSCNEYMVNCAVDLKLGFTQQTVDRCKDDKHKAIKPVQ